MQGNGKSIDIQLFKKESIAIRTYLLTYLNIMTQSNEFNTND